MPIAKNACRLATSLACGIVICQLTPDALKNPCHFEKKAAALASKKLPSAFPILFRLESDIFRRRPWRWVIMGVLPSKAISFELWEIFRAPSSVLLPSGPTRETPFERNNFDPVYAMAAQHLKTVVGECKTVVEPFACVRPTSAALNRAPLPSILCAVIRGAQTRLPINMAAAAAPLIGSQSARNSLPFDT